MAPMKCSRELERSKWRSCRNRCTFWCKWYLQNTLGSRGQRMNSHRGWYFLGHQVSYIWKTNRSRVRWTLPAPFVSVFEKIGKSTKAPELSSFEHDCPRIWELGSVTASSVSKVVLSTLMRSFASVKPRRRDIEGAAKVAGKSPNTTIPIFMMANRLLIWIEKVMMKWSVWSGLFGGNCPPLYTFSKRSKASSQPKVLLPRNTTSWLLNWISRELLRLSV